MAEKETTKQAKVERQPKAVSPLEEIVKVKKIKTETKKEEKIKETKIETKKEEKKEGVKISLFSDPFNVIQYPYLTEKAIGMVETENKLIFIVRRESTKAEIKKAAENALSVKVKAVNTLIDSKGRKKAIIQLRKEFKAADIATRFGML